MTRYAPPRLAMAVFLNLFLTFGLLAQQPVGPGFVDSNSSQSSSIRTFSFSGAVPGQADGSLSVIFAIYADQQSTSALWTETQVVQVAGEKYTTLLGSGSAAGLPAEVFAADQAHWLGVQVNGKETRYLLVSVPYAMKAVEAERLGGFLPSDFVTLQQLQSALQNAAAAQTGGTAPAPSTTTGVQNQAAAAGSIPLPATDFIDSNASEVLLVTQQGTGYAIHAITSSQAEAIFAENSSLGGIGLHAFSTNASGQSIGILGEVASPDGIAAEFNNRAGGKILSLRSNGAEVASIDSTGQVQANNFVGNGSGLMNIPPAAVGATSFNNPNSVVARDGQGNFAANQIFANTFQGNGSGLFNIPPSAVGATSFNNPNTIVARDATASFAANQIFANNFSGNGSGLFNIPISAVGGTAFNNPNTIVARDATASFAANQIFANNFLGNGAGLFNIPPSAVGASDANLPSTIVARDASGSFAANQIFANSITAGGGAGPALQGTGTTIGVQGSTQSGIALWAGASATDSTGTALLLSHASLGKLISGGVGNGTNLANEAFSVDAQGDVSFNGFLMTPYETTGTWFANSLVKLTSNPGNFGAGTVTMTSPGDTSGVVGVITGLQAGSSRIQVAQGGEIFCNFDGPATAGHYVGISKQTAGDCTDIGATLPSDGQQIVGRVVASFAPGATKVLLFGPEQHAGGSGTLTSINTGAGLIGGPITSSGTISIAPAGVSNLMLQNNSITVADGPGIGGGGVVPLGGTVTISNLGALSFNGRVGNIAPAFGDYNFSQIFGTATESQLPPSVVLSTQSNTFNANQSVNGTLTVTGTVPADNFSPFSALLSVNDTSQQAGSHPAFFAGSSHNQAAFFFSGGPAILSAGTLTHNVLAVNNTGMDVIGAVTATSFAGDGSGLSNVTASKIGALSPADIATSAALAAETTARQSADTTLQNNINSEASARQSADTALQISINNETTARIAGDAALQAGIAAETSARQSDVSNLQTSINTVSAADAKLAASNTFTAGTQDFSGAGATLPIRAVASANTPTSCVAGKELLIKTDAPAGQQLFICNAAANGWNLVGDGASGGVTAFNGRSGSVNPAPGDYSFSQISGSAAVSQLPASTVYNNQANTFSASQTVNGTLTASLFSGNGTGLSNVNAATLSGIPSNAFAQLHAVNSFTAEQVLSASTAVNPSLNMPAGSPPATPLAGDIWNSGSVIQYRDNASTTRSLVSTTQSGGLQLLKLTASITPANVANQTCSEQSFSVSGINTGDVLLGVAQPSAASPGTNISIGGFRVSAANTAAIQFCNVSRNNSTPSPGVYTFALMR